MVQRLVTARRVKLSDGKRWTPLHFACRAGHLDVVKILVVAGAQVDAANSHGKTPLDKARSKKRLAVVTWLEDPASMQLPAAPLMQLPPHL